MKTSRADTSEALVELRRAMNMSQAQFAVLVLDVAITTVARYETSHAPEGDLILRLARIAEDRARASAKGTAEQLAFVRLGSRFRELYLKDVIGKFLGKVNLRERRDDAG
jgi:transcriptional regulator with XRE-family HTH domain